MSPRKSMTWGCPSPNNEGEGCVKGCFASSCQCEVFPEMMVVHDLASENEWCDALSKLRCWLDRRAPGYAVEPQKGEEGEVWRIFRRRAQENPIKNQIKSYTKPTWTLGLAGSDGGLARWTWGTCIRIIVSTSPSCYCIWQVQCYICTFEYLIRS